MLIQFTAGKNFEEFSADHMLRSAVERQFEIIGEALTQLARVDSDLVARIGDHRSIIAFRNVLIHRYAEVDERIVWDVVEKKLAVLHSEVEALLQAQQS